MVGKISLTGQDASRPRRCFRTPVARFELPEILAALTDDDWQVRVAVATEIEAIGSNAVEAVPALIRMLEAEPPRWFEHKAAIDALQAITGWDFRDTGAWRQWWMEQQRDPTRRLVGRAT